jgi:hypothetical protein
MKGCRCEENRLWPILTYSFGIFLEELGKSLENFSQNNLFADNEIWNLSNTEQECYQLDKNLQ